MRKKKLLTAVAVIAISTALVLTLTACNTSLPYEPKPRCEPGSATLKPESTYVDAQGLKHSVSKLKFCGWP